MLTGFGGKIAIVTGGGSGIGQATSWALADAGATVIAADLNTAGLDATVGAPEAHGRITAIRCDVTMEADVRALVAVAEAAGGLDLAVNAAGVAQDPAPIEAVAVEAYDRMMAVNAKGVFLCMRHQVPAMLARGKGAIVNVASIAGLVGAPMMQGYNSSKHAVVGLTRSAALDVIGRGIRINAVCPGPVATPMLLAGTHGEQADLIAQALPIGRLATPTEIAQPILYLLSDWASFVVGTTLVADGGMIVA